MGYLSPGHLNRPSTRNSHELVVRKLTSQRKLTLRNENPDISGAETPTFGRNSTMMHRNPTAEIGWADLDNPPSYAKVEQQME